MVNEYSLEKPNIILCIFFHKEGVNLYVETRTLILTYYTLFTDCFDIITHKPMHYQKCKYFNLQPNTHYKTMCENYKACTHKHINN